jgi:excinuclease ABC subunit B
MENRKFKLSFPYPPAGDQAQAVQKLSLGVQQGKKHQVLLGVTGSGKTYTIAQVIQKCQKPTLIISHNKTLAAQLYQEYKEFFPHNGVGFFVSYYDYYQPEAYVPQSDTYIAKEADINQEIDKLRLQATSLLFSRSEVIIIASVSAIYNLGSPLEYGRYVIQLKKGQKTNLEELLSRLITLHYSRSRWEIKRGFFRVRGENLEIFPAYGEEIVKINFSKGKIDKIISRHFMSGIGSEINACLIYPAKHFLTNEEIFAQACRQIRADLISQVKFLEKAGRFLEAHRLEQKVNYDLEMIRETGYVNGIENYSRYFDGRKKGEPPWTLIDYFRHLYADQFLLVVDESHMTVPQLRGMYEGDLSRKRILIDYGFRLPSCLDNRPLRFAEFLKKASQIIYLSATPDEWEIDRAGGKTVEQLVRPTGLVDPQIIVKPAANQVQDLVQEIIKRKKNGQRVLVTTLTKKMAEELAYWLADVKNTGERLLVHFLHADVATLERSDILADLRTGKYDVVVGVNLLREGLDLPEVSLVAIIDADKQGFLRSKTALIQTMGRAARNIAGEVILYADQVSRAMKEAITEVERRRKFQLAYNRKHGIIPRSVVKPMRQRIVEKIEEKPVKIDLSSLTPGEKKALLPGLRRQMREAARNLDFEQAAKIRDQIQGI